MKHTSQELFAQYYKLRALMDSPDVTPEKHAKLTTLTTRLKAAAKSAQRTELTLTQQTAVRNIEALKQFTDQTRFRTTKAQNDILAPLNGQDLAAVLQAVN